MIQLIEKDLDIKKRSIKSPRSPLSSITARAAIAAAEAELLPYVGLSKKNKLANVKTTNTAAQLQLDSFRVSSNVAMAMPMLIEKIEEETQVPLSLKLFETFRLKLFAYAM